MILLLASRPSLEVFETLVSTSITIVIGRLGWDYLAGGVGRARAGVGAVLLRGHVGRAQCSGQVGVGLQEGEEVLRG